MAISVLISSYSVAAAAHPPVVSVSLQQADVPAGFSGTAFVLTNDILQSSTGTAASAFASHGRITGIVYTYTRGSYGVRSVVSQYRTAAGAAWEFGISAASDLRTLKAAAAPRIGDRSTGRAGQFKAKSGGEIVEYGVDVQKGVYDMTAWVVGPPGKVSMSEAVHYARVMVARVR